MRNMKEALHELQGKIGYQFQDETLLKQALTHSSFANEQKINKLNNYERLEFLGDAVLELVSSEFLYNENEDMPEGQLTRLRACLLRAGYSAQYLYSAWQGGGVNRREKAGFDHVRCDGGRDWRDFY